MEWDGGEGLFLGLCDMDEVLSGGSLGSPVAVRGDGFVCASHILVVLWGVWELFDVCVIASDKCLGGTQGT